MINDIKQAKDINGAPVIRIQSASLPLDVARQLADHLRKWMPEYLSAPFTDERCKCYQAFVGSNGESGLVAYVTDAQWDIPRLWLVGTNAYGVCVGSVELYQWEMFVKKIDQLTRGEG